MMINPRRLGWARFVARTEEAKSAFKMLTGTSTGKKHLGRPWRKWEENIRIALSKIGVIRRTGLITLKLGYWSALASTIESPISISHEVS